MQYMPFGISRLDSTLGGGAPVGNVVLLAGESGAGAREFLHTSAVMNALAQADEELFKLYYDEVGENTVFPEEIHYLSITSHRDAIERELEYTLAEEIIDAVGQNIVYRDFSAEYFQASAIPREWYVGQATSITDLGKDERRDSVFGSLGDYLSEHASGNLMLLDSVTDLIGAINDDIEWSDIAMLMRGLKRAAHSWGGLILVLVNTDTLTETQLGQLMDAAGGTFVFSWESGGSKRARVMVVREFRGVLSRLESEDIVQFETEVHDGGFDISDIRKIR
ncbi:HTR-like protein [Halorubraceae archaeon YAN]|nr:HTR-like protein [Halorubraceae archaeon YAN]